MRKRRAHRLGPRQPLAAWIADFRAAPIPEPPPSARDLLEARVPDWLHDIHKGLSDGK